MIEHCPECDTQVEDATMQTQIDHMGEQITVEYPVFECVPCAFKWTDERAQDALHEAIERHCRDIIARRDDVIEKQALEITALKGSVEHLSIVSGADPVDQFNTLLGSQPRPQRQDGMHTILEVWNQFVEMRLLGSAANADTRIAKVAFYHSFLCGLATAFSSRKLGQAGFRAYVRDLSDEATRVLGGTAALNKPRASSAHARRTQ